MQAYSALIVDHAPVTLRLADMLLRKAGFEVRTARDAEEALFALSRARLDVMLVALKLPGMDGLELVRCMKSDPGARETVALALASEGDRAAALQAGCEGCISTPFDPRTFARTVRERVESACTASGKQRAAALPSGLPLLESEMEAVRRRFLEDGISKTRRLLESCGAAGDAAGANFLLRRWIDNGEALGYADIAEAARRALEWLDLSPAPHPERIREALATLLFAFQLPPEASGDPLPGWVTDSLAGKRVGLAAFRPDAAERVCVAFDRAGAKPRLFEASESPDSGPVRDCSIVILQLSEDAPPAAWLSFLAETTSGQPLILAAARRRVLALSADGPTRAQDFLIDSWQPEEALLRCARALAPPAARPAASRTSRTTVPFDPPRPPGTPPEIVIADDDPIARCILRTTLEDYGMNCHMAADGCEALALIRAHAPDAAILDINMPGMDGYLALSAIREEKLPVPVLLLTARAHENDISRGFTLGADDYLVKPFNNVELVARLRRLIRREYVACAAGKEVEPISV